MNPVIEIQKMSCRFGNVEAVRNLTLEVPVGSVYAFLGTNGAGKTTTIKTLLNLLQPSAGTARIFGVDSTHLGPPELARIGYVSENQQLPEKLNVQQMIDYCRALYANWDDALCRRLVERFALPMNRPIRGFSRGMKTKAALLVSLAYRPELLLMDEPFAGLDPLVRDDLVQGMLELSEQENWTVFISSHDIDEVERLADHVGMIDNGVLTLSESSDSLRTRFRRVDAIFAEGPPPTPDLFKDALSSEISGLSARWIENHYTDDEELGARIRSRFPNCQAWSSSPLALRDAFVALTRAQRATPPAL
ncbi:ABC transporter-related protein [Chthoniobacter flavus Ellin428]|uniref:ABC transporter-related protein n=1 Tax=Chthoniobacter flavus Ellin428 TaxID=497964 RepID=B4DB43_9BACT|nr:ABC transporter ATP-binding protein [Chthoniobacter flavus]EDY16321.1 ABC transporter-related protein [Chthoniobacter flavus Ellin428]TCO90262.1 ABC-2 type transport system ATP-binding protein [Chthoniobacter flavus]